MRWRQSFISAFLERDIPQLGITIPASSIERLWRMCAHHHGQVLNLSQLGASLGVSHTTARAYVELLARTFMVRVQPPFLLNSAKRLVKSPKIYLRDTGILHALLDIETWDDLLGHPVFGHSWESMVIENVLAQMPGVLLPDRQGRRDRSRALECLGGYRRAGGMDRSAYRGRLSARPGRYGRLSQCLHEESEGIGRLISAPMPGSFQSTASDQSFLSSQRRRRCEQRYADAEAKKKPTSQIPVGRLGRPEDVAGLMAFLASSWVTSSVARIMADGGRTFNGK
jgi:hypothetical protein